MSDQQSYYVPPQSHWPVLAACALFLLVGGFGVMLNALQAEASPRLGQWSMVAGVAMLAAVLFRWFGATIRENMAGLNNAQLKQSYVLGMCWFIFSEVMFFFIFFFALFYVRNFAGPWLGDADSSTNEILWKGFEFQWPMLTTPQQAAGDLAAQHLAVGGEFVGPHKHMSFPGWTAMTHWLPLWNTLVLLSSSFTVHLAHTGLKAGSRGRLNFWLGVTVLLGMIFLVLQYLEYHEAYADYGLTLRSGIYGTTFFMLTGFHGFHVCLGAFMLLVMWLRATTANHFSPDDHFGFEAASWYWHFVDVVWVCLFLFVYIL